MSATDPHANPHNVVAYTDGSCPGNPGPGGWAWYVKGGPWANGYDEQTTNQRMELRAALEAVRALPGPLVIVSDSRYLVNGMTNKWYEGWIKRGWLTKANTPVANRDLWELLVARVKARGDVTFRWVKGHSGSAGNDEADRLAGEAVILQAHSPGSHRSR